MMSWKSRICVYIRYPRTPARFAPPGSAQTHGKPVLKWKRMTRAFENRAGRLQKPTTTSARLSGVHYWGSISVQIHSKSGLRFWRIGQPGKDLHRNCTSIVDSRQPNGGCSGSLETPGTVFESSCYPLSFKYRFPGRLSWSWWCKSRRGANTTYIHTSELIIKKQCYIWCSRVI